MISSAIYSHFPVICVMGLFLFAFLVTLLGKCKCVRNTLFIFITSAVTLLMAYVCKQVLIDGEVISYWMGNWEPVAGYAIGIGYEIDGLNAFFAILVVLTIWLSSIYSIKYMSRDNNQNFYYTLFLLLSGSVLGLVLTGDVFNMFVMIEIMTFAAVALTAFRNGRKGALEAAFKYLVVGCVGSGFTLTGITLLYMNCHTLNMAQLSSIISGNGWNPTLVAAFALMFTGFGVKSFIVPFHAPAADAYMSAPTSVSMLFSGMVNKAGVYGLIRVSFVIFRAMDQNALQILMVLLGTVTMFIGVTMALAQHDLKRLLAFHSISQIGYVITAVGLTTALGISGGLFHALNHTLFKGLLFLCAGAVFYATGTTNLDKLGGLSKKMPKTTICFLIGAFSISGLPPFNGFASKWMIYSAAWEKASLTGNFFYAIVTIAAVVVSVMTLASFIKVTQAVFFGQAPAALKDTKEVPFSMRLPMWIMSALCLFGGIFYELVYKYILRPATNAVLNVTDYIDKMLGEGTAAAAGVTNIEAAPATLGSWKPIYWLILFATVLIAVCIVVLLGSNDRGRVLELESTEEEVDGKYATFFGGEKSVHSHVSGSDLFWGFKKNFAGYFNVMTGIHSGSVNDYSLMAVCAGAVFIVVMFIVLL